MELILNDKHIVCAAAQECWLKEHSSLVAIISHQSTSLTPSTLSYALVDVLLGDGRVLNHTERTQVSRWGDGIANRYFFYLGSQQLKKLFFDRLLNVDSLN